MTMPAPAQAVDPRAIQLWRLQGFVRLFTAGVPAAALVGFGVGHYVSPHLGAAVAGLILSYHLMVATYLPRLTYDAIRYEVREHDLLVQSGVFFRQWSSVPLARIQHVDTRQGPMERIFGLARLQVYTAAGMSADASLAGLDEPTAEALRDELSRRGGDDGV